MGQGKMSHLWKHLDKHKMYLKVEECGTYDNLKVKPPTAAVANVTMNSISDKT